MLIQSILQHSRSCTDYHSSRLHQSPIFDRLVLRTHCFYLLLYLEASLLGVSCNILHIRITVVVLHMWKIPFWSSVHKYLRKYSKPYSWMAASAGNSRRTVNSHVFFWYPYSRSTFRPTLISIWVDYLSTSVTASKVQYIQQHKEC